MFSQCHLWQPFLCVGVNECPVTLSVSACGGHCKSCKENGAGKCDEGNCDDKHVLASDKTCKGKSDTLYVYRKYLLQSGNSFTRPAFVMSSCQCSTGLFQMLMGSAVCDFNTYPVKDSAHKYNI